jgi:hypothetical protein
MNEICTPRPAAATVLAKQSFKHLQDMFIMAENNITGVAPEFQGYLLDAMVAIRREVEVRFETKAKTPRTRAHYSAVARNMGAIIETIEREIAARLAPVVGSAINGNGERVRIVVPA